MLLSERERRGRIKREREARRRNESWDAEMERESNLRFKELSRKQDGQNLKKVKLWGWEF